LVFKVIPGSAKVVESALKGYAMFQNSDVNRCPQTSLDIFDMKGEKVLADVLKLISINPTTDMVEINPQEFKAGSAPIEVQLGMTTGFGF